MCRGRMREGSGQGRARESCFPWSNVMVSGAENTTLDRIVLRRWFLLVLLTLDTGSIEGKAADPSF